MRPGNRSLASRLASIFRFCRSYAFDYLGFVLLFTALFTIRFFLEPVQQLFRLDDRAIQYPYAEVQRVSSQENTLIAGVGPLIILTVWAVVSRPGLHKVHVAIVGLFFSVYLTNLATDIIKNAIGRPRPDLIDRCQPQPGTPAHSLVSISVCMQIDRHRLLDGWRSFPSGHSSWAFSGLGYLSFFIAGQMRVFRPRTDLTSIMVFLAPLIAAAMVAMTRLADYRHDIYDVSSGSLLGLLVAYMTYRRDYRPLTHPECDTPYIKRAEQSLALPAKPRLEQAEHFEDTELLRSFHSSDDDASKGEDIELGSYPGPAGKQDAGRISESGSRRSRKLKTAENSSHPTRRGKQHSSVGHHVATRLRRRLIRNWKESSLVKLILILLGLMQSLSFLNNFLGAIFPDGLDLVSSPFKDMPMLGDGGLDRLTAGVQPIMCHSHDDFFRDEPLFQAIRAGCTSVEADVWHVHDELYVAHTTAGIRQNRTLKSLYLDPIQSILDHQNRVPDFARSTGSDVNGVFAADPKQSLVLLVDFKNDADLTWQRLSADIASLRDRHYLTSFNGTAIVPGPVTIVASGNASFESVMQISTYRDIFYDAPLDSMASLLSNYTNYANAPDRDLPSSDRPNPQLYSPANSYFASASFVKTIGYPWHSSLSRAQLDHIRRQIRGARSRGLKVRYYGIPVWPVGLRNYIWRVLVREGVDYLSVDNIDAATKENWGPRKGGWGKKWWL